MTLPRPSLALCLLITFSPLLPFLLTVLQLKNGVYEGGEQSLLPAVASLIISVLASCIVILGRRSYHFPWWMLPGIWLAVPGVLLLLGVLASALG